MLNFIQTNHICTEIHACFGAYVMCECVCRSNTTLLKLTLDWNAIMDEGVASLAAALRCDVKPPDMCLISLVFF